MPLVWIFLLFSSGDIFVSRMMRARGLVLAVMFAVLIVQLLRERRCLLIFDNFESLMQPGAPTGTYRTGYADYGELIRALSEREHQSCLLLTSREKPASICTRVGRRASSSISSARIAVAAFSC